MNAIIKNKREHDDLKDFFFKWQKLILYKLFNYYGILIIKKLIKVNF